MEDEKPDEETADNIRMIQLAEKPESKLGIPPLPLRQKEESAEFIEGYKEGYAHGESRKPKRF
jgi:hypothetical protein